MGDGGGNLNNIAFAFVAFVPFLIALVSVIWITPRIKPFDLLDIRCVGESISDRIWKRLMVVKLDEEVLAKWKFVDSIKEALHTKFDEEEHPRHPPGSPEGGQFAPAGGGGGSGGTSEDEDSASSLLKPEDVSVDSLLESVPGSAERVAECREKMKNSVETDAKVEDGGYKNSDGSWTADRAALHESILTKVFTPEVVARATPAEGEKPVMHILGGRGGSGKSFFTSKKGTIDKTNFVYLNNDDFKSALPEYEGWNAGLLHEESSDLGRTAEALARDLGLNVIIDGTLQGGKSAKGRVDAYKAAGYRVEGHYMFTSPATSAKRALERFMRGGKTGRFVPPEYSLGSTTNEASFDKVKDQMDFWEIYDNNGSAPKFHARSK